MHGIASDCHSLAERGIRTLIHPFTNLALHRERGPFRPDQGIVAHCALRAQKHGLIVRALGDTIAVYPPLIIEEAEIDELFDRIARALSDTETWAEKNGLRKS